MHEEAAPDAAGPCHRRAIISLDPVSFNLANDALTRLALTSLEARVVQAAIDHMKSRSNLPPEILEYANAHLSALTTRDKAMELLRHYQELVPKLDQRIRELEAAAAE